MAAGGSKTQGKTQGWQRLLSKLGWSPVAPVQAGVGIALLPRGESILEVCRKEQQSAEQTVLAEGSGGTSESHESRVGSSPLPGWPGELPRLSHSLLGQAINP